MRLSVKLSKLSLFLMILAGLIFYGNIEAQDIDYRILFLSDHEGSVALYTMQADGTNIEKLVDSIFEEGGVITSASLSPDGTTLAVSSKMERSLDYFSDEIFLLDMATSSITMLTNDGKNNTLPSWSPDSQGLAYLTGSGINGYGIVHIFDLEAQTTEILITGTALVSAVSDGMAIRRLSWSPDGSQLVLSGQTPLPDAFNVLVVVDADGTNAHQVTPNEISVGVPSWSSDSNIIYALCSMDTYHEICRLNIQTSQIDLLSDLRTAIPDAASPYITSLDVSPEGEIIFSYGVVDSSFYRFNEVDGSVTEIGSGTGFNYELLGWVDISGLDNEEE